VRSEHRLLVKAAWNRNPVVVMTWEWVSKADQHIWQSQLVRSVMTFWPEKAPSPPPPNPSTAIAILCSYRIPCSCYATVNCGMETIILLLPAQ
jgi:hypothetical protein